VLLQEATGRWAVISGDPVFIPYRYNRLKELSYAITAPPFGMGTSGVLRESCDDTSRLSAIPNMKVAAPHARPFGAGSYRVALCL
jgi:hypothetical protein